MTFYRTTEELPDFADYRMRGRTYRYMENEALYPFGHGLSYTTFSFENVSVNSEAVTEAGVELTVKVKNTGKMACRETVQVCVKIDREGALNAQLKGLKKIYLEPGQFLTAIG